jgi:DNA-binding MltR family transcriptional regulator
VAKDDGRRIAFAVSGANVETKPIADFLEELNKESDRGAVLISAAFLDDLLRRTLRAFLIENTSAKELVDEYPGPLSTFSARIHAAHALGLISDDERHDCHLIRKVRNEFAHPVKMSFADDKVFGFCGSLRNAYPAVDGVKPNVRTQFTSAAVNLITLMRNRPERAAQRRLKFKGFNN